MKKGYLSQYFKGIAAKTLSAVETDTAKSNQHEFNGVAPLKKIFGLGKQKFPAKFFYLSDNNDEPPTDDGFLTWYDSRENHAKRTEHRMYFPTTAVSNTQQAFADNGSGHQRKSNKRNAEPKSSVGGSVRYPQHIFGQTTKMVDECG